MRFQHFFSIPFLFPTSFNINRQLTPIPLHISASTVDYFLSAFGIKCLPCLPTFHLLSQPGISSLPLFHQSLLTTTRLPQAMYKIFVHKKKKKKAIRIEDLLKFTNKKTKSVLTSIFSEMKKRLFSSFKDIPFFQISSSG